MTAKEFLSQGYKINLSIEARKKQIEELRSIMFGGGLRYSDTPGNPNKGESGMENKLVKVLDMERKVDQDIDRLITMKDDILNSIENVLDPQERALLSLRYIKMLSWEKVAQEMGCSLRNVHNIHGRAIDDVVVPEKYL